MARGSHRGGGASGRQPGGGRQVQHRVERAEQNLIWELANDVWRPVRHPDFGAAQAAARRGGRNLPDPRANAPVHARPGPVRLPRDRQADMADDLGYRPTTHRGVDGQPIFENPDGRPRYISYDMDGHATVPRDASGRQIPYDPNNPDTTAPAVAWKGADTPRDLRNRYDREGTYIPTYDANGNVEWRQPRPGR